MEKRKVYAISALIAFIHDIDIYLTQAKEMTKTIVNCITYMKGASNIRDGCVNLSTCSMYESLENTQPEKAEENSRYLQQRTDEWFKLRKTAKVTGSKLSTAIGIEGLGKEKDYFETVICGVKEREPTDFGKRAMQHGTDNEINAVATLVGVIIPALYPDLKVYEERCVIIAQRRWVSVYGRLP